MQPSPPDVEVRQAVLSDIPRARQIHKLLFPEDPHTYAENIHFPTTCNMVAMKNGEVVGYASSLTSGAEPEGRALWRRIRPYIGFVGVHPDHQQQGIGTALLLKVYERLFEITGALAVYLETHAETLEVYTKAGFVPMSTEEVESAFGRNPSSSVVCRLVRPSPT